MAKVHELCPNFDSYMSEVLTNLAINASGPINERLVARDVLADQLIKPRMSEQEFHELLAEIELALDDYYGDFYANGSKWKMDTRGETGSNL